MHPVMNDTKWEEIRLAMYGLGELAPRWRTLDLENGHVSEWDGEWFHHFRIGGYRFMESLEIAVVSQPQREAVLSALVRIRVPGEQTEYGFKVFGYVADGAAVDYLKSSNRSAQRTPSAALTSDVRPQAVSIEVKA